MHQEEQQKATALASAAFISSLGDQEALERLWTVSPRGKYQHDPRLYFSALVQLAKVLKFSTKRLGLSTLSLGREKRH